MLGVGGCSDQNSAGTSGSGYSGKVATSSLKSIIDNAPSIIANKKGFWDQAGADLTPVDFEGGTDVIRGMLSGMNIGVPSPLAAMIAYNQGQENLRLIGSAYNGSSLVFIAPADSPINSVDELAGTKMGFSSPGGVSYHFTNLVIREAGLTPGQDVETVAVGGGSDAWTAAKQGIVDVAYSAPPFSTQLVEQGEAKVIFHSRDAVRAWTDIMLCTTAEFIESNRAVVQDFVDGYRRACNFIRQNTDEAAAIYGEEVGVSPTVAKAALHDQGNLDVFSLNIVDAGVQANIEAGIALGQLERDFSADAMIVKDFIR